MWHKVWMQVAETVYEIQSWSVAQKIVQNNATKTMKHCAQQVQSNIRT